MIRQLQINNFRNYADVKINLPQGEQLIILHGNNGEGKTNVLESISLFSGIGGFRAAKHDEMINKNSKHSHWNIILKTDEAEFSSGYTASNGVGRRIFKVNDKNVRNLSEFLKENYVLWMTYESDRLFLQAPANRRHFIDMFASAHCQAHGKNVRDYERLTRERLKILKNHAIGADVAKWLDILEEKIVTLGLKICCERADVAKRLEESQLHLDFPEFRNEMTGGLEDGILHLDVKRRASAYAAELCNRRAKDGLINATSFGPNRSDWRVLHVSKQTEAGLCSAGEQKMLLSGAFLSFVNLRLKEDPRRLFLLIDDVIAHLDATHKALFFHHIKELMTKNKEKLSIWLTGTSRQLFEELADVARFFLIHKNTVTEG